MLILNAGVMGTPFTQTEDGYEHTFHVNHLAQFALALLLRPALLRSAPARVVVVSSESHRFAGSRNPFASESFCLESLNSDEFLSPSTPSNYWYMAAYNRSKMCNVLFAFELSRLLSPRGVTVNVLHPGNLIGTDLSRSSCLLRVLFTLVRPFTKTLDQGAATTIYCVCAPELARISGHYFNNCWLCEADGVASNAALQKKLWDVSTRMIGCVLGDEWLLEGESSAKS